jgi:hypothetical protein
MISHRPSISSKTQQRKFRFSTIDRIKHNIIIDLGCHQTMKSQNYMFLCMLLMVHRVALAWVGSSTSTRLKTSLAAKANKIITCGSTKELEEAVRKYVQPHHVVAELGAQLRDVSTQICENAQKAVLVDVTRKFPKARKDSQRTNAMRLETCDSFYPQKATFTEISQLKDWRLAFFGNTEERYDVLVLDVNAIVGNDLEWTSLSLIQQFEGQQPMHHLIVLVKSVGLHQFASRLIHGEHWKGLENYKAIPPPHIVATVGVQEYRNTIPYTVQPNDAVLEVGCHFGTTTAILHDSAKNCIGIDVGSKIIGQAQERHPGIFFSVGDAWKTAALLRIQQDFYGLSGTKGRIGFDVVYVDVGGLSGIDGLLEAISLVSSIRHSLEPRCIVIKSLCMQRLSSKLVPFWQTQKQQQAKVTKEP